MKTIIIGIVALSAVFGAINTALAHTPLMSCYDNGDGTVTCNGEFSDGASTAGTAMRVVSDAEEVLVKGAMDGDGEFTFRRPEGSFTVIFDAGPGHLVKEKSDSIVK